MSGATRRPEPKTRWLTLVKAPGPVRLMAEAGGYVMVRRPGCVPFVMTAKDWRALPLPPGKRDA